MVNWTIPEYLDAHPNEYPGTVIRIFKPEAPPESADKLSDWYTKGYNQLYDQIDQYQEAVRNDETPDASLKMSLLTYGTANLPDKKEVPSPEPVAPEDPEDPITENASSGGGNNTGLGQGIRTYTTIGGDVVSKDIISITATLQSGYDEGNEQSTCTVTLNNNFQKYGKKIASYEWAPRITRIWSQAAIDFNTDHGVETNTYMIFQGFMSDAKYNNETATVTFGCISIEAAGSFDDSTWSPEDGYELKMQDKIDEINAETPANAKILDLRYGASKLIKQDYTPSDLSGNESLRSIAQDNKESFYFGHDFEDNVYVVLTDSDSNTGTVFLDPYVIDPGDTSTIFGHANDITVIAGTTDMNETMRHIPTPVKDEIFAHIENTESIYRYAKTAAYITHDANLQSVQANIEADLEDENFKAYIDRDIKVVVANKIPKILSIVIFTVPDVITGELRWIYGGVKKKEVEYSSSGIISHLEVARINTEYGNEITIDSSGIITSTDEYTDSEGNIWQYVFRNGQWIAGVWGPSHQIPSYTENVTPEIIEHYKEEISIIEANNNTINPNWRNEI